jgi:hypothetical protein
VFQKQNPRDTHTKILADIALLGQEHRDMADEEFGILKLRPVIGVGVDD